MPAPFKIFNTLDRQMENFVPLEEGKIKLYVCGMTVYDHAHVGHARAMVVFDAFVRYLRSREWDVTFVRNFTDVDDKIIKRANENGEDPMALANRYIDAFQKDAGDLGLIEPDKEPRVSTSIPQIIELIEEIVEKGHGYVNEGSVWFDVKTHSEYGKLSGQKVDELRSADPGAGKRNAADFALWKAVKPGEPSWESPWGPGRPGWHIECSAMARDTIGKRIDIHGGGLDLVFPHHENEIAQSECANGCKYTNYWMHNGLLTMAGGQKMGKSLGNVINIRDALEAFPAEAVRIYLLQNHYRSPLPWSSTALVEALSMLAKLYEAKENAVNMNGSEQAEQVAKDLGSDAQAVLDQSKSFIQKMNKALDEDFNTSLAISHAFDLARTINRFAAHKKAKKRGAPIVAHALSAFQALDRAIGLLGDDPHEFLAEVKRKRLKAMGLKKTDIEMKLDARAKARQEKDWAQSDAIRDQLDEMGIIVMDTPGGVDWRIRL